MQDTCQETAPTHASLSQALACADALAARIASSVPSSSAAAAEPALVAICVEEGLPLALLMMAVLRAGYAFVLLDPALPSDRLAYLLHDSVAALVVHATPSAADSSPCSTPAVAVAAAAAAKAAAAARCPVLPLVAECQTCSEAACGEHGAPLPPLPLLEGSSRLAYVCYTSGSTGRPKGVAVSHGALYAYALANANAHRVTPQSRVLLATAVSFDPCIGEAWTALLAGAMLCLPSRAAVKASLTDVLRTTRATHVCSTPALWATVAGEDEPSAATGDLPCLECVTLGGEKMGASLVDRWAHLPRLRLYNVYGVTECCAYQSSQRVGGTGDGDGADVASLDPSLLGTPLPGCTLHLLDDQLQIVPPPEPQDHHPEPSAVGGVGQVAVGGPQLALGYYHRPELTRAHFVSHPALGRVYLTGDVARWVRAGPHCAPALSLIGRNDSQVKVNGMRLELGEVEGALAAIGPLCTHAAATLIGGRLYAAVQPSSAALASSAPLAEAASALLTLHARRWLPSTAVPTDILVLGEIALTPTGKLDRLALGATLTSHLEASAAAAAAQDGTEAQRAAASPGMAALTALVRELWVEALGVSAIGPRSDFLRLGGDSIKALQVARWLAFRSSHSHGAPPTRYEQRRGAAAAGESTGAELINSSADYGILRGVFAPAALLTLPLLCRYVDFLWANGVRAPEEAAAAAGVDRAAAGGRPADADADADPPLPPQAHPGGGAIDPSLAAAVAAEAVAEAEEELRSELACARAQLAAGSSPPTAGGVAAATATGALGDGASAAARCTPAEQALLQLVLAAAAAAGAHDLAAAALALGADPAPRPAKLIRRASSQVVNERGLPPLHIAAREGQTAVLTLLLDAGAKPTLLSNAGLPPLHVAVVSGAGLPAVALLLERGAPLAMRDDRRQTALHAAARVGHLAAVRALIEARCDLELRDHWHRTALHWATVNQQEGCVLALAQAGAKVDGLVMSARKHTKSTSLPLEGPLHSAARLAPNAAAPLIRVLLAAKADPRRTDQFGQTPLHLAATSSALAPCALRGDGGAAAAIVALLEGHMVPTAEGEGGGSGGGGGADLLSALDSEGRRPLDRARLAWEADEPAAGEQRALPADVAEALGGLSL